MTFKNNTDRPRAKKAYNGWQEKEVINNYSIKDIYRNEEFMSFTYERERRGSKGVGWGGRVAGRGGTLTGGTGLSKDLVSQNPYTETSSPAVIPMREEPVPFPWSLKEGAALIEDAQTSAGCQCNGQKLQAKATFKKESPS